MRRLIPAFVMLLTHSGCATLSEDDKVVAYLSLYYAASNGNEQLVEALLARGAPIDLPEPDGPLWKGLGAQAEGFDSPLQAAARQGETNIVRLLLKHKPWVDRRCCDGPTAFCLAKEAGHTAIADMLLQAGADPKLCAPAEAALSPNKALQATSSLRSAAPERRRWA